MKKMIFAALAVLGLAAAAVAPTANANTFPTDQSSYAGGNG